MKQSHMIAGDTVCPRGYYILISHLFRLETENFGTQMVSLATTVAHETSYFQCMFQLSCPHLQGPHKAGWRPSHLPFLLLFNNRRLLWTLNLGQAPPLNGLVLFQIIVVQSNPYNSMQECAGQGRNSHIKHASKQLVLAI